MRSSASAGSGVATFALPDSAGVPRSSAGETIVLPYNDLAAVEAVFAERGQQIAAVITEAAPGNMGVVPPAPGFTEGLRRVTRDHGALLITDEVMTGFRCSRSGFYGLEGPYAAGPADLFTFGKVMGGGFPTAAFGGRAEVMALLAPAGPGLPGRHAVGQPGRLRRGLATLRGCTDEVYARLDAAARAIADAASEALSAASVPHTVQWAGSMFSIFFREGPVRNYDDAKDAGRRGLPSVLPRDARAGRPPAAQLVRGVVRLRGPRRRRGLARPCCSAGGRPRRCRPPSEHVWMRMDSIRTFRPRLRHWAP